MDDTTKNLLDIILKAVQTAIVLIGAIWAYFRFFREGQYRQRIELYIDCNFMGPQQDRYVAAFTVHVTNRGKIEYRFEDIRLRVRGITTGDPLNAWKGREPLLRFPSVEFETVSIIPLKKKYYEYELQLMPSLNDVRSIPRKGKNQIFVAAVNNVLHFRIFDGDGERAVGTDEKRLTKSLRTPFRMTWKKWLTEQAKSLLWLWPPYWITRKKKLTERARQVEALRKLLKSLWPPNEMTEMTGSDKGRVVTAVASILGDTLYYFVRPGVHQRFSFVTMVPVSWKYVLAHAKFMYKTHELHTTERVFEVKPDIVA